MQIPPVSCPLQEGSELLVPKKGLEPPHPCEYVDLNHARLPIPPLRHLPDQRLCQSAMHAETSHNRDNQVCSRNFSSYSSCVKPVCHAGRNRCQTTWYSKLANLKCRPGIA